MFAASGLASAKESRTDVPASMNLNRISGLEQIWSHDLVSSADMSVASLHF
jgi:hypothetical protein